MGNRATGGDCRLGLRFEHELQTPAMLLRIFSFFLFVCLLMDCKENPSIVEPITEEKEVVATEEQQNISLENGEDIEDDEHSLLIVGEDQSQALEISTIEKQRCKNALTASKSLFGKIAFGWRKRSAGVHESCACHPQTTNK